MAKASHKSLINHRPEPTSKRTPAIRGLEASAWSFCHFTAGREKSIVFVQEIVLVLLPQRFSITEQTARPGLTEQTARSGLKWPSEGDLVGSGRCRVPVAE